MDLVDYMQKAEDCFRSALEARQPDEQCAWLGLASSWLRLGMRVIEQHSFMSEVGLAPPLQAPSRRTFDRA